MSDDDRLISSETQERSDPALRPERLPDKIGQPFGAQGRITAFLCLAADQAVIVGHDFPNPS